MRNDSERRLDISEAIGRIEQYAAQGKQVFEQDELIQTWVVYHLQVIGEAARALSVEFKAQYPDLPWVEIVGLRNVLVHEYFRINVEVVWAIVEADLPDLKLRVTAIFQELNQGS
ncbi:DUF86 domain-containing protein [Myxacorys almedinensis]|uniref:DUF86 domain-containing protein n=1 Tax=Myxacorys almedinensis A TaxID=2690445 RepID=A0A8J8CJ54_9CYAN|nr:DUF86 domain-containing protein [Myxacorys almedinensis]NDJ18648.1 DUF86 domain-containing protein [Myxacorys almedinensis A]